jgi:aryl-alcohol dehydrogenase-like predicted oxidoreductase
MEYRRVGSSGLRVSEIALGSWLTYGAAVGDELAAECIHAALDAGVIFFDTADVYSRGHAEEVLGKTLSKHRRADLVIATKAYFPMSENPNDRGLSRKHLFESIHQSLRRLGTDYVDLYQCHRFDGDTPVAETVRAMDDLVRQGKILYWGVSHWSAAQIKDALKIADAIGAARPISNQPPYSMLDRRIEDDVLPFCKREGLGQVVFSPLAEGILTGKYSRGTIPAGSRAADERAGQFIRPHLTPSTLDRVDRLSRIADEAEMPLPRLALAWTLRDPGISSAIVGASRPEQVRENVTASGVVLPGDLLRRIEAVLSS